MQVVMKKNEIHTATSSIIESIDLFLKKRKEKKKDLKVLNICISV